MQKRSLISGAFVVTGTVVGAGMLALPTAMAGIWFVPSLAVLGLTWLCMICSGLMILEASTHYPLEANFTTIVRDLLGRSWNLINGITLAFVLYIVTYAYIAVGGDLTQTHLNALLGEGRALEYWQGQTIFFVVLALCVTLSRALTARFNMLLVGGMFVLFLLAVVGLLRHVSLETLFNQQRPDSAQAPQYWRYIWVALPVALTSFGFQSTVPSVRQWFSGDNKRTAIAVILGGGLALAIYILWQIAIQGNLPRHAFAPVIAADGQVSVLLQTLAPYLPVASKIGGWLVWFTYLAIATSFLGVTLGLMDYIADLFQWHAPKDRFKAAALTFLPPYILCVWKPYGFVTVIGYAGMAVAVWALIVPALMLFKARKKFPASDYCLSGGHWMGLIVLLFGLINIVAHLLGEFGKVPVFMP